MGILPTETVVGLVAGGRGLLRLFEIKDRHPGKPIALLCGSAEEAFALSSEVSPLALSLADHFWPGPLTLVLDAARGGTVGVRVPDHPVAQALLAKYKVPLYATSANLAGEPAPRVLEEVNPMILSAADFAARGEPGSGEASAVVDLSGGKTRLLRATESLTEAELARLAKG